MIWSLTNFACANGSFLGFPTWYHYVQDQSNCANIKLNGINDFWLIVAAVLEILLRIAALAAVGFIIYGGFQYVTSQAEPGKTSQAKDTIINALVGLVIAILAAAIVNFIATKIT